MLLYGELASWYHLIDPRTDHEDEAAAYRDAFVRAGVTSGALLELGAGAGNNAWYLKADFTCTLTDIAPAMLALSRAQNPECEHVEGDMRTLDLGRTFDAVLVHDAIVYMTTEADLQAVFANAFRHLRPGGVAVFAPDTLRDVFFEKTALIMNDDEGQRSVRGLEWTYDPDPSDTVTITDYVFMLRDGNDMRMVQDRHVEGLFARADWERLLAAVGFEIDHTTRPSDDDHEDMVFVARRPA